MYQAPFLIAVKAAALIEQMIFLLSRNTYKKVLFWGNNAIFLAAAATGKIIKHAVAK